MGSSAAVRERTGEGEWRRQWEEGEGSGGEGAAEGERRRNGERQSMVGEVGGEK